MRRVPLKTAHRDLAKLIKEAERGESVLPTRSGKPVAEIVPTNSIRKFTPEWYAACRRMDARKPVHLGGLRINRDEPYGR